MGKCVIDREIVAAPERCRLLLDIDERRLGIAVVDRLRPADAIWREVELSAARTDQLVRALEDAVYDNPVLLSGFDAVEVVVRFPWISLMPTALAPSSAEGAAVVLSSMPEEARSASLIELAAPSGSAVDNWFVMCGDTRLVDFLRRTFANPRFHHPLEAMCAWFCANNRQEANGRMLAHFAPGRVDLMAFGPCGPLFANSFAYVDPLDAVYFTLAVRSSLDIGADCELLLCGDVASREAVVPLLRQYVRYAMPLPPLPVVHATSGADSDATPPFHIEVLLALAARQLASSTS